MPFDLVIRALVNGVLMGAIYGLLGMGFSMVYGVIKLPNFAHGVFTLWGMYALIKLANYTGIGPYPGFIFLFLLFFIGGVLIYKGLFKYILDIEHEMQLVFCLGILIVFSNLAIILFGPTSLLISIDWLDYVITPWGISMQVTKIVGACVSLISFFLIHLFLTRTETGKAVRACADNRKGALITGLNVETMYAIAVGISVVCAAVAALALVPLIAIYPGLGFEYAVLACLVAVLGGAGSMTGTLISGFVIGLLLSLQQIFYDLSLATAILYIVMILILMIRPTGLLGARD